MFNQFQKDLFQRILSNYAAESDHIDQLVTVWFSDPSTENMSKLVHNLAFYGRLECLDPSVIGGKLSRLIQPLRKTALEAVNNSKEDRKESSLSYRMGFTLRSDFDVIRFHATSQISEIVAAFVSLVAVHDSVFLDIQVMNDLRRPYSGVIGRQDFTYWDHFGYPADPSSSSDAESDSSVSSADVVSHSYRANLLTYPSSLYTLFINHVGDDVMIWDDPDSDCGYAVIRGGVRDWLDWQLSYCKRADCQDRVQQIESLISKLDEHVSRASIEVYR